MPTTTTSRLLELLSLLQLRRDWPGAALADRLAVSPRTVRRDIERLREMGYSIHGSLGPDGGYRLDAGSELPPLLFDDDQIVALAVALQLAAAGGEGIEEPALRALTTVRQVLPSRLRHRLDAVSFTALGRRRSEVSRVEPEVLVAVSAAVRARETLRFDYASDDGSAPPRRVEPHHLVADAGRWYLLAWDLGRDDWRTYRVDRMAPRVPTGPRFAPRRIPGGDAAAFVSARFKGSDAADRWPCTGAVVLQLPLHDVLPFAGDGVATAVDDGRTRLESGAWSWNALAASLLRFDAEVEVVDPPELRRAFAELAARSDRAAVTRAAARSRR